MGYDDVELLWSFDNFGRTQQAVRATLDHEGSGRRQAHMAPEVILKDWDKSSRRPAYSGTNIWSSSSLPDETQHSIDAWRQRADRFNTAGAAARHAGIWLAFHNEPDHMKPIDGAVPYDVFIARLDPAAVRLQLDVGNMLMGHGDPMHYLAAHPDRYWSFHLKDVVADGSRDVELGTGTFDFARFLAAVPDLSHKPCYVEQENTSDELASARVNCAYLRRLSF
jgi:sugar phosphate isomerase/epimerase